MEAEDSVVIVEGVDVIKVAGRGRPKGKGCNLTLLKKMKHGACIWGVSFAKMNSIRTTAHANGIKVKCRREPDSQLYIIWKL